MFHILGSTILPIFSIILLGYLLKVRRILPAGFVGPANTIVYYVAIPAMFLNTITRAPFRSDFNLWAVLSLLAALVLLASAAWIAARVLDIGTERRGTFLQSCFHGNIGYLSYSVAYYALGESHFAQTAILSSFLIIGQNILAVWSLTASSAIPSAKRGRWILLKYIAQNPIVLAIAVGVVWALLTLPVPHPIRQILEMLSGMAFPMALLLIGASLSFHTLRSVQKEIASIGALKMVVMPLAGYLLMTAVHVPPALMVCGIILLATPPATVTYVMAVELGGDPELAATSVSVLTLASAFTYSAILMMIGL